jgi:hypothetical protein
MDDFDAEDIELDNLEAVKRWCWILTCSESDLIHAVQRVGPSADAVSDYLEVSSYRAHGLGSGGSG